MAVLYPRSSVEYKQLENGPQAFLESCHKKLSQLFGKNGSFIKAQAYRLFTQPVPPTVAWNCNAPIMKGDVEINEPSVAVRKINKGGVIRASYNMIIFQYDNNPTQFPKEFFQILTRDGSIRRKNIARRPPKGGVAYNVQSGGYFLPWFVLVRF